LLLDVLVITYGDRRRRGHNGSGARPATARRAYGLTRRPGPPGFGHPATAA